jgi:hypothetical protein
MIPGIVLPIQGISAAALLFSWLSDYLHLNTSIPPEWEAAMLLLAWIVIGYMIAVKIAHYLGNHASQQFNFEDLEKLAYELIILCFQAPAILIYTLAIAKQISSV